MQGISLPLSIGPDSQTTRNNYSAFINPAWPYNLWFFVKRPLGMVALLYTGGLLLAEFCKPSVPLLFSAALGVAAMALALRRTRHLLLWPLIILTGWTNLVSRTAILSPNDLRNLLTEVPEDVAVRGELLQTPDEHIYLRDGVESSRTLARISVSAIRRDGLWRPAFGRIAVTTPGQLPGNYFKERSVEIAGIIATPPPPLAEGLFDYRAYLRRQGIYFALKTDSASDWKLLDQDRSPPLGVRFLKWAKKILSEGLPEKDQPLRLLWAMTLGSRNALTGESYDPFIESGTMHIFAISGLHIALIAGILVSLLRLAQVSRLWCGAVVIPLIWFYTAATGWQPSAIRSSLMMSIIIAGWSLKRPTDLLNSLAAAAFIILLWDPEQLFQASFQLSFFVVLSIALILPPIEKFFDRLLRPDPLLPIELLPGWRRWLGRPLRFGALSLATSIAAWLGSWPLTAHYFHLFSPATLLANLLVVPLSSAALASNLGSMLCGAWCHWACVLFNNSAWFWMCLMMKLSQATTKLPGSYFYVCSPRIADFLIYYGALVAVLSEFAFAPKRRAWSLAALCVIGGFYLWRWESASQTIDLTVLPLSGGSSVFCDAPGRAKDLLVDCGSSNSVEFVLKPFLRAQGVNQLQCLALTHGDTKHVGGAGELETLLPIRKVAVSSVRFRSSAYRKIVNSLEQNPERKLERNAGERLGIWDVLNPDPTSPFPQADDNALVLSANIEGHQVLLLSDLGQDGQRALMERIPNLHSEIVVACLPERGEPLCDSLLHAIAPRLIVISDSEYPATKRAGPHLRERLESHGIPVIYTRNEGAIRIRFQKGKWSACDATGKKIVESTSSAASEPTPQ